MSTNSERVLASIAGRDVEGRVVDEALEASYGRGPKRVLLVDVDGAGRYRVPESQIQPRA